MENRIIGTGDRMPGHKTVNKHYLTNMDFESTLYEQANKLMHAQMTGQLILCLSLC